MLPLVRVGDRLCAIGKPLVLDVCSRHRKLWLIFVRMFIRMGGGIVSLVLLGCVSAENKMVAGNIAAINHVEGTAINWFSVNGYRAHGGGGSSCCIILPVKWRPGLKVDVEWEVDSDPYAYSKWPPLGSDGYRVEQIKHKANYRHYRATVNVPEWPEKKLCSMNVHFLTCKRVEVTTSCSTYGQPDYPVKEPRHAKEPVVCQK